MAEVTNETLHEILLRVECKVDKTNGRVRKLETWRGVMVGGLSVLTFLMPFALYFLKNDY